jgi:mannose-1-phosphate guanylyltransferase
MPSRAYFLDPTPTGSALSQLASAQSKAPWAVVLAGGDGTRLQRLTLQISGDTRPKQFCKLMGGDSLLGQTCRRIEPLFARDRQLYV